jgi:hypothetical protein
MKKDFAAARQLLDDFQYRKHLFLSDLNIWLLQLLNSYCHCVGH